MRAWKTTAMAGAMAALAGCTTGSIGDEPVAGSGAAASGAPVSHAVSVAGPEGPLAGTYLDASGPEAPVVVIVPGSGPTDRDGNNPLGVTAATYRLLAEQLAVHGIDSLRFDKRGMFGSEDAIADPNAVTIADYAEDVTVWAGLAAERSGQDCAWVAGHSEGSLIALAAADDPGICGLILLSGAGRSYDAVVMEQLEANPANAPILDQARGAFAMLRGSERVDTADLHPGLAPLFAPQIQGFLSDAMRYDPAAMVAATGKPVMIVHGLADIQVAEQDARLLAAARPGARLVLLDGVTHVLKRVEGEGRAANLATYADASKPVDPRVADAIAWFVRTGAETR